MRLYKKFLAILLAILLISIATIIPISPVLAANVTVSISPTTGAPGTAVYVYGNGCTAGSTYTITFGSSAVGSGLVPTGGTVAGYFTVPIMARGSYSVAISTNAPDSTGFPASFTLTPQIYLASTSGSAGDQISINGNGFYPSTPISIYFDGVAQTLLSAVSTDYSGQFNGAVIAVPVSAGGAHIITAGDSGGVSLGVSYRVLPKLTLSANTAAVGSSITVSGNGFSPSAGLSFFLDSTAITVTANSDTNGNFSNVSIAVPAISGGPHTLTATDNAGNSLTATLSVTASHGY